MSEAEHELEDGSTPCTSDELFRRFDELGIRVTTVEHRPVYTVEESRAHRGPLDGGHSKNLFLRNKKGAMWLVVCREDRVIDLKTLAARLGAGRFSFGSATRLMKFLGVIPGAVTPFAVVNDRGRQVRVVLDRALLDEPTLNFHPLDNAMTTSIRPADLLRFMERVHRTPELVELG